MARRLRGSGAFKYCRQALQYSRNLLWKVDFLERGVAQGFQFELKKGDSKNVAPPKVIPCTKPSLRELLPARAACAQ